MPSSRPRGIAVLGLVLAPVFILILAFSAACGKSTGVPADSSTTAPNSLETPFDHGAPSGSDPSAQSPPATPGSLPEGTPITVRLLTPVSSASSHPGDTFEGVLDDPIAIEDQTAVPRGEPVTGRVLAVKASRVLLDPGYLRIALVSVTVGSKKIAVETSSLFLKGRERGQRDRGPAGSSAAAANRKNDVAFGTERQLVFRLAQAVEIR